MEVPYMTCAEIIRVARDVRQLFGLNVDHYPVVHVLEMGMLILDSEFTFSVKDHHEMKDDLGLTIPSENAIYLRSDVYNRASEDVPTDRFTVAHELGHHFLHKNVPVVFHQANRPRTLKPEQDSEWQANIFGAALLMPVRRLNKCRSLEEAAVKFCVSKKTVAFFNRALVKAKLMKKLY
ncbi:ImmA/IrrE family metallo-endopeptidase [Pseudomonas syringae]|uniref:ImmA/IrrE family metallo-endopeptidase n=1 Tax=Pseudomonas syringae TaxID=317 RepID=UPI00130DE45E|nr:ImmA/IrrE family metallo-endopeptidase [Pseudomonas syringae]